MSVITITYPTTSETTQLETTSPEVTPKEAQRIQDELNQTAPFDPDYAREVEVCFDGECTTGYFEADNRLDSIINGN